MPQKQKCNQFTVVQQKKGRIRIVVPCLFNDKERASILQILLLKRQAIEEVQINLESNSVKILYDLVKLPEHKLLNLLDCVLVNFSQKPRKITKKNKINDDRRDRPAQENVFGIRGMSCDSCALFLEMVLSRSPDVFDVSINFKTETGLVSGYLSKGEIFKIIEKNGFQAYSFESLTEH